MDRVEYQKQVKIASDEFTEGITNLRRITQRLVSLAQDGKLPKEFPSQVETVEVPEHLRRLTSKELEVLALVAKGLNNEAIGSRLCISTLTVSHHLNNLYPKLPCDTSIMNQRVFIAMEYLRKEEQ